MRLHSDKGYLYLILFMLGITLFHLLIQLLNNDTPQILKHIIDPTENQILNEMYVNQVNSNSLPYLFRNLILRYIIYPVLVFTFIVDHYGYGKYLEFITWKKMLLTVTVFGGVVTLVSKPFLMCPTNLLSDLTRTFFCQINFFDSSAGYYVYAIVLWVSLVTLSFKVLRGKMLVHHALWFSLLVFLSIEEVWEYAPFLVFLPDFDIPLVQVFSLNLMRAIPSFLLLYYGWRYGLSKKQNWFWVSLFFSVVVSVFHVVFPEFVLVSLLLRVVWAVSYVLFVYSFNISLKNKVVIP